MDVIYWQTSRGDMPVVEYIGSLAPKDANKMLQDIATLREFGIPCPIPKKVKKLRNYPLWELVSGKHRTLFFVIENKSVLVHAFRKDSRKTRQAAINLGMIRYKNLINMEQWEVQYGLV